MEASADRAVLQDLAGDIFKLVIEGSTAEQWAEWLRVPLEHASRKGDIDLVKTLLRSGADGSTGWRVGCDGGTLLGAGAVGGNEEVITALLEAGGKTDLDVPLPAHCNGSALHVAVAWGAEGVAEALMRAGADVHAVDDHKRHPLHLAAELGYDRLVADLLLRGARPDEIDISGDTPLHLAAQGGHTQSISALLTSGANRDLRNGHNLTPLSRAFHGNHVQAAEKLLLMARAGRSDANYLDGLEYYWALVERAAENRQLDMLRMLISWGGNLPERQLKLLILNPLLGRVADGFCIQNNASIIKYLIESGADTEFSVDDGFTALLSAASKPGSCPRNILALLRGGANVNAQTQADMTALHFACRRSDVVAVRLLLRWGAEETVTSDDGRTAMDVVGSGPGIINSDQADDDRIRRMLARALTNRSWRRRSWLVLCRSCPDRFSLASEIGSTTDSGEDRGRGDGLDIAATTNKEGENTVEGGEGWGEGAGDDAMTGLRSLVARVVGLEVDAIFCKVVGYL